MSALHERLWWDGCLRVEDFAVDAVRSLAEEVNASCPSRSDAPRVTTDESLVFGAFRAFENLQVDGKGPRVWSPMSGFFQTEDGWVRLHGNYLHHQQAISKALRVDGFGELRIRLAEMSSKCIEDQVVACGGVAAAVRSESEWHEHPQALAMQDVPWIKVEPGENQRRPLGAGYLEGIKVLDLSRVIAGPTCTQVLGYLGATVLRVDAPGRPEILEQYLSNGMGKRSALADFNRERIVIDELVRQADVVVVGYRPGSLIKFGLDPQSLLSKNPGLVVASLSAWGERGPWAERRGFDSIVQAACGIADVYRDAEGNPGALPAQALDHATGYRMAASIVRLLRGGSTGIIRASLLGAAHTLLTMRREDHRAVQTPAVQYWRTTSHGKALNAVPVPLRVDGEALVAPIGDYGKSALSLTEEKGGWVG